VDIDATPDPRVGIVIATRDRRDVVSSTLPRQLALPERPRVIVVDDASADGTAGALGAFPGVEVLRLDRSLGGAARNAGAAAMRASYVAFSDDDAWWRPGALRRAADLLDAHPRLAVVQARILVGAEEREDPTCAAMGRSPLARRNGQPGHAILSFVACAVVIRRQAFLAAGGFSPHLGVGGEEELLGWDLSAQGWQLSYVPDVVGHHHPPQRADRRGRRETIVRNALWSAWLRRTVRDAARSTARLVARAPLDSATARGLGRAVAGLPWVLRERCVSPPHVEAMRRLLE
jgi:N-acetylglucosaminyl-diphospho-decaprenol L-rhamnosyltransferase